MDKDKDSKKGDPKGYKCWMGFAPKAKKYYRVCKSLEELDAIKRKTASKMIGKVEKEGPDMSKVVSRRMIESKDFTKKEKEGFLKAVGDKKQLLKGLEKMAGIDKPKKKKKLTLKGPMEKPVLSTLKLESAPQTVKTDILKNKQKQARLKQLEAEKKAGEPNPEKEKLIEFKEKFNKFKARYSDEASDGGLFAKPIMEGKMNTGNFSAVDEDAMGKFLDLYFKLNRENAKMPKLTKGEFRDFKKKAIYWLMKTGTELENGIQHEARKVMDSFKPNDLNMEMLGDMLFAYQSDDEPTYQFELGGEEVDPDIINELGGVWWSILSGMLENKFDFDMIVKEDRKKLKKFFEKDGGLK